MSEKENSLKVQVKKETLVLIVLAAFGAGFLSGVVATVMKSTGGVARQQPADHPATSQSPMPDPNLNAQIDAMEQEVVKNPDNVEVWTALGNIYFDKDRYKDSIRAYKKSLELRPNANVWTDLGVMYRRNGQPKMAVEAFDKAVFVDPSHEMARFNKGIVLLHDLNDMENAIKAWQELVEVNPLAVAGDGTPVETLIKHYREQKK